MFYLPLCNHSPKITSNTLSLSVLSWLQMPRFICNHLPPLFHPSFTLVSPILWNGELPFAAQAAFKIPNSIRRMLMLYCMHSLCGEQEFAVP